MSTYRRSLLEDYVFSVLEDAREKQISFVVLGGISEGSLTFDSSDVDILCEDDADIEALLDLALMALSEPRFSHRISLLDLRKRTGSFQLVLGENTEYGISFHMLDCAKVLSFEQLKFLDGKALLDLQRAGFDPIELARNLKRLNKSKMIWPRVPEEYLSLRYERPTLLQRSIFYARKVLRLLSGYFSMRRGFWIAFFGMDGAGKSSLIERLHERFDSDRTLIPLYFFHWRPPVSFSRKVIKAGTSATDPHSKPPRGYLVSVLKLGYLIMRYNLGYFVNVRPLLVRNGIVIADRYYHDLLADPRRYRYGGPMWLARLMARFIPKPDLFIFLDLPAEVAHSRKPEVPLEEARELRERYLRLARFLPNSYIVDASKPLEEVVAEVERIILDYMADRTAQRFGLRQ